MLGLMVRVPFSALGFTGEDMHHAEELDLQVGAAACCQVAMHQMS